MPGVRPEVLRDLNCVTPDASIKKRPAWKGGPMFDYVDVRYVEDVLDAVVGPENWQTSEPKPNPMGGTFMGIGILVDRTVYDEEGAPIGERSADWVWKWDVGKESDVEPVKGAVSGGLKRSGVHWGIARDLYDEDRESARPAAPPAPPERTPVTSRFTAQPNVVAEPALFDGNGNTGGTEYPWTCPVHHEVRVVPGGTSKAGKPYNAFYACSEPGCDQTARGIRVLPQHMPAPAAF